MPATPVMPTVVLVGTLDTKGGEYDFVREQLRASGVDVVLVDTGVLGRPTITPDVTRDDVAAAAGVRLADLVSAADRGAAVTAMAEGARAIVAGLRRDGRCDAAMALGGTGGTSVAARAFEPLPLGVPKVIVSTAASGDTRPYVGETDLILMPSVVDIAGVNRISAPILANAAHAVAGMVTAPPTSTTDDRPLVAASMFGVTTPCIDASRRLLTARSYEVVVFHMTGTGGRTLESLARQGLLAGVLDATTTELADELVGGVMSAGPDRLTGTTAIPRVVSVGALDMVNFGAVDTVPARFAERNLYVHNPTVTLMRTTAEECAELGRRLATRVSGESSAGATESTAPAAIFLPLKGISAISTEGGPFHDPAADAALFDAVRRHVDHDRVEIVEIDTDINDPDFAAAMVERLDQFIR